MARRSKSEAAGPTRLLVVNDESNSCELVARILESAGWTADRCTAESDAIVRLSAAQPAYKAVVIDLSKGGSNQSVNLLETIRSQHELSELPIVVLTSSERGQVFAWQSGVDGFLVRPFHADDLINEIYAALARTSEERAAYRAEKLRATEAS